MLQQIAVEVSKLVDVSPSCLVSPPSPAFLVLAPPDRVLSDPGGLQIWRQLHTFHRLGTPSGAVSFVRLGTPSGAGIPGLGG